MNTPELPPTANINKLSLLRFIIVGGSATLLHYLIMTFLIYLIGTKADIASSTGYIISTIYNYWANSRYAFGGGHIHRRSLPRFLMVASIGLAINQIILLTGLFFSLSIIAAQLSATALVFLWNYLVNATWTFARDNQRL